MSSGLRAGQDRQASIACLLTGSLFTLGRAISSDHLYAAPGCLCSGEAPSPGSHHWDRGAGAIGNHPSVGSAELLNAFELIKEYRTFWQCRAAVNADGLACEIARLV